MNELTPYDVGFTTFYAARGEPRVHYCLFVPERIRPESGLIVIVHGTDRIAQWCRDAFASLGTETGAIVVAPLFPAGLTEAYELESYKLLTPAFRSDLVLLDIVEEVAERYGTSGDRFVLHGFSGGGHFAHRFFYLHPDRLRAVSIGAPGLVTILGDPRPWWVGVGDMEHRFRITPSLEAMRNVATQMVVGSLDTERWEIVLEPDDELWIDGCNDAGSTRIERLETLKRSFVSAGVEVRFDVVPDVAHDHAGIRDAAETFIREQLASTAQSVSGDTPRARSSNSPA